MVTKEPGDAFHQCPDRSLGEGQDINSIVDESYIMSAKELSGTGWHDACEVRCCLLDPLRKACQLVRATATIERSVVVTCYCPVLTH
jgi:hypothetical protein